MHCFWSDGIPWHSPRHFGCTPSRFDGIRRAIVGWRILLAMVLRTNYLFEMSYL